ncbi:MAG: alanine racemase, partial [Opitutae bacterium]
MQNLRCWAEIDLAALERNLNRIRTALPAGIKYISVVKADAYGHGIHPTAARLMQTGVDLFAVANVKEAMDIREMGSGWPILILGPLLEEEDQSILEYDLIPSLSNKEELERFVRLSRKKGSPIKVHLKIDTGMGRMGCWWEQAPDLLQNILSSPGVDLQGVLTHFPLPQDSTFTNKQRERFLSVIQPALSKLPNLLVHADNSSSLQTMHRESPFNGIRIGLLQFGIAPPRESVLADIKLEPVLSFHSRLALVKDLPAGASLSYGCEKILKRDSRIGVIAAGYGDAIPLHCGGKAHGLIGGCRYPLVGRVTMDQTLIDLTDAKEEPSTGQLVTLIGKQQGEEICLSELANFGNTIEWELLCS